MSALILKLITKQEITDSDIVSELYDMCDREHSSCNSECIIYRLHENSNSIGNIKDHCKYFKNGTKMLEYVKNNCKWDKNNEYYLINKD